MNSGLFNHTMDAKKYNKIKIISGIVQTVITFILIFLFVSLGLSKLLYNAVGTYSGSEYVKLLLFVIAAGFVSKVIFYPAEYYTEFYLEHKYNLSNQTFFKWILEDAKGILVGGVIGLPILLLFYSNLNMFGSLWWLPFAVIMFLVSVLLAKILPVFILPLFYKLTAIEDEELKERIIKLSSNVGLKIENVFKFNISKNTKKANAAFTGLGKTKKILLGDTLLDGYTKDEIETVIAHELGHYKHKHIVKNIIIATISSFLMFFVIALLYQTSLSWFGFSAITEIPALPILVLWSMLIALMQNPLINYISRKFEYEADKYAVLVTGKKAEFITTLEKLTEQNLGDKDPHPFVEWFFYSHPSIKKRIEFIQSITI